MILQRMAVFFVEDLNGLPGSRICLTEMWKGTA
jgi:hypothetical protein